MWLGRGWSETKEYLSITWMNTIIMCIYKDYVHAESWASS